MTLLFFSSNSSVLLIPSEILAQWKSLKCVLFKGSTDALYLKVSSHFISFDPDCHPVGQGGQVLFPLWGEKNPESWEGAKAPTPTTVFFTRPPDASTETAVPDCPHTASLPVLHSVPGLESKCTRLNIYVAGRGSHFDLGAEYSFCVSNPLSTVYAMAIPALPGYLACLWQISNFKSPAEFVLNSHGTWGCWSSWKRGILESMEEPLTLV